MFAIAYHFLKDAPAAEDVVHDVMLSLWKRKDTVHIEALDAYLATATKFAVFKQIHQRARKQRIMEGLETSTTSRDLEEKLDARFLEEFTAGIVERLPAKTRVVFKMSRQDGMPVKEIASSLGVSGKSVEYHLTKALKALRDSLRKIKIKFF